MRILTFTLKDTDVDLTYHNGLLAYTMEFNGKRYGNSVRPTTSKRATNEEIIGATWTLFENALSTLEKLQNET